MLMKVAGTDFLRSEFIDKMEDGSADSSKIEKEEKESDAQSASAITASNNSTEAPSKPSTLGISFWTKSLKIPQPSAGGEGEPSPAKSAFARLASGISLLLSPRDQTSEQGSDGIIIKLRQN